MDLIFLTRALIVLVVLFLVSPLLAVLLLSSSPSAVMVVSPLEGFSLRWFFELLADWKWLEGGIWSLIIAFMASITALIVAFPVSFSSMRTRGLLVSTVATLLILPIFIPPIVIAMGMYLMLDRFAAFDTLLGIVFAHQTVVIPPVFLILRARFREETLAFYDIARLMGAPLYKAVFTWLWNSHQGTILAAFLIGVLVSFNEATITIYVSQTNVSTITRLALSGIARDIRPVGFAFLTTWWLILIILFLVCRKEGNKGFFNAGTH